MESRLKTINYFIREKPLSVVLWKVYCRLFNIKIPNTTQWLALVDGKSGLEIGGPSNIFLAAGYLPIYSIVHSIDGVNFSEKTIWEGSIERGNSYNFGGKIGFQYISEGNNLWQIRNDTYEFLLSCNNLEHMANPIKSILEWKRVIKSGGIIILVLPRKESNFDHKRPPTQLKHLINDFETNKEENDLSHLNEILELHDLTRDPRAGAFQNFENRSRENIRHRSLHHHVFTMDLLCELMNYTEMEILITHSSPTDHYIAASRK
jgi:SAM-dependent methyltransferase